MFRQSEMPYEKETDMTRDMMIKAISAFVVGLFGFCNITLAQQMQCEKLPDCESLGYTQTPDCLEEETLACPFDESYKKCVNPSCETLGFTTENKSRWCHDIVFCPTDASYTLCAQKCDTTCHTAGYLLGDGTECEYGADIEDLGCNNTCYKCKPCPFDDQTGWTDAANSCGAGQYVVATLTSLCGQTGTKYVCDDVPDHMIVDPDDDTNCVCDESAGYYAVCPANSVCGESITTPFGVCQKVTETLCDNASGYYDEPKTGGTYTGPTNGCYKMTGCDTAGGWYELTSVEKNIFTYDASSIFNTGSATKTCYRLSGCLSPKVTEATCGGGTFTLIQTKSTYSCGTCEPISEDTTCDNAQGYYTECPSGWATCSGPVNGCYSATGCRSGYYRHNYPAQQNFDHLYTAAVSNRILTDGYACYNVTACNNKQNYVSESAGCGAGYTWIEAPASQLYNVTSMKCGTCESAMCNSSQGYYTTPQTGGTYTGPSEGCYKMTGCDTANGWYPLTGDAVNVFHYSASSGFYTETEALICYRIDGCALPYKTQATCPNEMNDWTQEGTTVGGYACGSCTCKTANGYYTDIQLGSSYEGSAGGCYATTGCNTDNGWSVLTETQKNIFSYANTSTFNVGSTNTACYKINGCKSSYKTQDACSPETNIWTHVDTVADYDCGTCIAISCNAASGYYMEPKTGGTYTGPTNGCYQMTGCDTTNGWYELTNEEKDIFKYTGEPSTFQTTSGEKTCYKLSGCKGDYVNISNCATDARTWTLGASKGSYTCGTCGTCRITEGFYNVPCPAFMTCNNLPYGTTGCLGGQTCNDSAGWYLSGTSLARYLELDTTQGETGYEVGGTPKVCFPAKCKTACTEGATKDTTHFSYKTQSYTRGTCQVEEGCATGYRKFTSSDDTTGYTDITTTTCEDTSFKCGTCDNSRGYYNTKPNAARGTWQNGCFYLQGGCDSDNGWYELTNSQASVFGYASSVTLATDEGSLTCYQVTGCNTPTYTTQENCSSGSQIWTQTGTGVAGYACGTCRDISCDNSQGYYITPPIGVDYYEPGQSPNDSDICYLLKRCDCEIEWCDLTAGQRQIFDWDKTTTFYDRNGVQKTCYHISGCKGDYTDERDCDEDIHNWSSPTEIGPYNCGICSGCKNSKGYYDEPLSGMSYSGQTQGCFGATGCSNASGWYELTNAERSIFDYTGEPLTFTTTSENTKTCYKVNGCKTPYTDQSTCRTDAHNWITAGVKSIYTCGTCGDCRDDIGYYDTPCPAFMTCDNQAYDATGCLLGIGCNNNAGYYQSGSTVLRYLRLDHDNDEYGYSFIQDDDITCNPTVCKDACSIGAAQDTTHFTYTTAPNPAGGNCQVESGCANGYLRISSSQALSNAFTDKHTSSCANDTVYCGKCNNAQGYYDTLPTGTTGPLWGSACYRVTGCAEGYEAQTNKYGFNFTDYSGEVYTTSGSTIHCGKFMCDNSHFYYVCPEYLNCTALNNTTDTDGNSCVRGDSCAIGYAGLGNYTGTDEERVSPVWYDPSASVCVVKTCDPSVGSYETCPLGFTCTQETPTSCYHATGCDTGSYYYNYNSGYYTIDPNFDYQGSIGHVYNDVGTYKCMGTTGCATGYSVNSSCTIDRKSTTTVGSQLLSCGRCSAGTAPFSCEIQVDRDSGTFPYVTTPPTDTMYKKVTFNDNGETKYCYDSRYELSFGNFLTSGEELHCDGKRTQIARNYETPLFTCDGGLINARVWHHTTDLCTTEYNGITYAGYPTGQYRAYQTIDHIEVQANPGEAYVECYDNASYQAACRVLDLDYNGYTGYNGTVCTAQGCALCSVVIAGGNGL